MNEQDEGRACLPFAGNGFHGEVTAGYESDYLMDDVARLVDPASALETIHWGRNYLYTVELRTPGGAVEVVVKQFRNLGIAKQLERRLKGSKATRSWRVAKALVGAGIATPEPVVLIESDLADGPSFFVARRLHGVFEVRHFFRRLNGEADAGDFPEVEPAAFLAHLGGLARRLHDAGIWYRDLSLGNVLAQPVEGDLLELYVVDFNRARLGRRLGTYARSRDICRFPVLETAHREAFLGGYWGAPPPHRSPRWWIYVASVNGYILKHSIKGRLRRRGRSKRQPTGGKHHAHIPAAADGAAARDKAVWDHLSDQPHQHAGRFEKYAIRCADAPSHVRDMAVVAAAAPRVRRRYRELMGAMHEAPTTFRGVGLCLRPSPDDPEAHLALVDELGVCTTLIRLHPWAVSHDAEEALARELFGRGHELAFVLPQNRDLVRDRQRWRATIEELAERFAPYGRHFQVGQAVNRSKWGIWTRAEYISLYLEASEILRRQQGVEVMGPAVIDFELQVTMALLNRRTAGLHFDIVSSLLYVDRRGAPENAQLGFDTVAKVALLKAIADTARNSTGRCWITEVNWPLWEGPHSPAGRTVSVDEEAQADYLARFYLLALGTGLVERVYWWRLIARGYGLVAPGGDGVLRRRPAFFAMKTLHALLEGATLEAVLESPPGSYLYHFVREQGDVIAGWSTRGEVEARLPRPPVSVIDRDGGEHSPPDGVAVVLSSSPGYFLLGS